MNGRTSSSYPSATRLTDPLRGALSGKAAWACLDGRWDEALVVAEPLIAEAERGNGSYTDAMVYSTRAWIRLARGDDAGADRDSREAAERARASDAQAQAAGFPIRAAVAIALGDLEEASACATELAELGPVAVTALSSPFPTLADVAWVFRDLGREDEFVAAILDKTPIDSLWVDAARAITAGKLTQAAEDHLEDRPRRGSRLRGLPRERGAGRRGPARRGPRRTRGSRPLPPRRRRRPLPRGIRGNRHGHGWRLAAP